MRLLQATLGSSFLALLALSACVSSIRAQTIVPLDPIGGWLTVMVTIAPSDTLRFILDTGAARSAVSHNAAGRLGLEATRSYSVQGASGPATVSSTRLDELRFAGMTVRDIEVLILEDRVLTPDSADGPQRPFDGVLGFDVLRSFSDVLISSPERRLVLYADGQNADSTHSRFRPPIRFGSRNGLFVTHEADVGGTATTAILDSGARHLVLNDAAAGLPGVTAVDSTARRATQGVGTTELDVRDGRLSRLEVGGSAFADLPVRLSDLPVFSLFGLADQPAMLIGVPVLAVCPVLISYRDRTVRYCRGFEG
jgi:predicted aspartyl protease